MAFAKGEMAMLHLELIYRRLPMGQEFLRKRGTKEQQTQTEFNDLNHSSISRKRSRKTRIEEAIGDQLIDSENTLTKKGKKQRWRLRSQSPPPQGQRMYSTHI